MGISYINYNGNVSINAIRMSQYYNGNATVVLQWECHSITMGVSHSNYNANVSINAIGMTYNITMGMSQ